MPSLERSLAHGAPGMTPAADTLSDLLTRRFSCRAYLPDPVPRETIATMLSLSQNAASWCNSQPWHIHVTQGAATERLRKAMFDRATADVKGGAMSAQSDLPFPEQYTGVYKERQREVGWQLYEAVGVAYGDRAASARQMLENFRLFGAPHALVITTEKNIGTYGVLDCGSYLGTLLLAAQSLGIGMIPQAAFANYCPLLREFFDIPANRDIVCGASFGFPDMEHPANAFRSRRAAPEDAITWAEN
ncbi:nitroreductase [Novosphingobium rosa]|uniref:nitroreductase n=1 Tax=Novosphingobium rosa TaxID=76978 RepID=UPI000A03C20A|nr:nitroreductase [Novosphingobium rosa]